MAGPQRRERTTLVAVSYTHLDVYKRQGVMTLVAVHGPVAFFIGNQLNLPHLPNCHVRGYLVPAGTRRRRPAVSARDQKFVTMKMDGVVGHCLLYTSRCV